MLSQEVYVSENVVPLYGTTMPEFVESEREDNSNDNDRISLESVENAESSEIMKAMTALSEAAAEHIMPHHDVEFEMSLEGISGEQMVSTTFLSHLEEKIKEIKSLFQTGEYNNNLFDVKRCLEQFHGLKQEICAEMAKTVIITRDRTVSATIQKYKTPMSLLHITTWPISVSLNSTNIFSFLL